jgi:hypothetical protein
VGLTKPTEAFSQLDQRMLAEEGNIENGQLFEVRALFDWLLGGGS